MKLIPAYFKIKILMKQKFHDIKDLYRIKIADDISFVGIL